MIWVVLMILYPLKNKLSAKEAVDEIPISESARATICNTCKEDQIAHIPAGRKS